MILLGDMNFQIAGEGDPILLINGYSGNASSWNPDFIDFLAQNHTVITFDNKGSSIREMSENAYDVVKEHDIKTVFGYSMGGFIAQELAIRHPDSIDNLILSSTRCGGDDAVYPSKKIGKQWLDKAEQSETLKEHYNAVKKWKSSCDNLDKIKADTLIIIGTEDEETPIENSYFLNKEIEDSKLVKIEGGYHNLTSQYPSQVASLVNEFLNITTN
jgi:pimeloyl-ACP methyl ester carboxylesterase